jgi:hypothetical protein
MGCLVPILALLFYQFWTQQDRDCDHSENRDHASLPGDHWLNCVSAILLGTAVGFGAAGIEMGANLIWPNSMFGFRSQIPFWLALTAPTIIFLVAFAVSLVWLEVIARRKRKSESSKKNRRE